MELDAAAEVFARLGATPDRPGAGGPPTRRPGPEQPGDRCSCPAARWPSASRHPARRGPVVDLVGPMPYTAVQSYLDDTEPEGLHYYWRTEYLAGLDDEGDLRTRATYGAVPAPSLRGSRGAEAQQLLTGGPQVRAYYAHSMTGPRAQCGSRRPS
jgi:hypothetical protein